MTKKFFISALSVGMAAGLMMSASAAEPSVDEIMQNYYAASSEVKEMNATAAIDIDASLDSPVIGTQAIKADVDMDMGMIIDPMMKAAIDMTFDVDTNGEAVQGTMTEYMDLDEENVMHIYTGGEAAGETVDWQHLTMDIGDMQGALESAKSFDFSTLPIEFTLENDAAVVDDIECYELKTTLTWDNVMELINQAMTMLGEDSEAAKALPTDQLAMVGMFAQGICINMTIDLDKEYYVPMRVTFDIDGSDFSTLEALMGNQDEKGNVTPADITVNACSLVIDYYYGDPVEVSIPEEALNAPAQDLNDMAAQAGGMIGEAEEALEAAETEAAA